MRVVRAVQSLLARVHPLVYDSILVVVLSIGAVTAPASLPDGQSWPNPAVLGVTVPLLARRRYPLACFVVQLLGLLVAYRTNGVATVVAFVIGVYSMGVHSQHRVATLAASLGAAILIAVVFAGGIVPIPSVLLPFLLLVPAWLVGNAIRTPTLRAEAMRERALRIESEQEAVKAAAAAAERARIARELHDVVAHSVSVMVVQAGAARQVVEQEPEAAVESMLAVEASGRQALTELRRLLDLLGEDEAPAELQPQPGVDELGPLVERITAAGQPVEMHVEGTPRPLPPGLDLTVYRVVQEALTNAIKYARGARTEVFLSYAETALELRVLDDGPGVPDGGTGRGLIGMRQRVAMYGGELEAGLRPGRGYAVRARIPLDAA